MVGDVVLTPFPFTDLSQTKIRPAVVLADVGMQDWVLCEITSSSQPRDMYIANCSDSGALNRQQSQLRLSGGSRNPVPGHIITDIPVIRTAHPPPCAPGLRAFAGVTM